MAAPVLTPSQTIALTAAKNLADSGVLGAVESAAAWNTAVIQQQEVDDAFKAFFDYYGVDIIGRYEDERRWLDGQEINTPIVEQDILDFANEVPDNRLSDGENKIPLRISQFDGSPLQPTNDEHENFLIPDQDIVTDRLVNFLAQITTFDVTAVTTTALTSASTSLSFESDETETISGGDLLFIGNGVDAFIVQVNSVGGVCTGEDTPPQTSQATCEADNGVWTVALNITVLLGTSGSISSGADLGIKSYTGFTDTERTNKIATVETDFQPLMDLLLEQLHDRFDRRVVVLDNQITELQANDDPALDATAETKVNVSKSAIIAFLGGTPPSTIDISDTGLTSIESETATRLAEVTARITAIASAITAGTFFDLRYNNASDRARLDNGSIRLLNEYTNARDNANASGGNAQGLSDRYDGLLNP